MSLIRLHLGPNRVDFVPRILFLPIFQIITKYPLLPLFQKLSICVTLWRQWQKQSYPFPSVIVCLPVMSCVSRIQDLRLENPTRSLLDHTASSKLSSWIFLFRLWNRQKGKSQIISDGNSHDKLIYCFFYLSLWPELSQMFKHKILGRMRR